MATETNPVHPSFPVPAAVDLRALAAVDSSTPAGLALSLPLSDAAEAALAAAARNATQLIANALFSQPTVSRTEGLFASIADAEQTIVLPRAKPVPSRQQLTRWERFASSKGIQKSKRERMVYDEASGEYKPRWGYMGGEKNKLDDWIMEVPDNTDPTEDQFQKKREEKRERIQKNQMRQRRNQEEALAASQGLSHKEARRAHLHQLIKQSKTSTASFGRFDKSIENEGTVKIPRTEKRKFDSVTKPSHLDKEKILKMAEKAANPSKKAKSQATGNNSANSKSNAGLNLRKSVHGVRSKKR